MSNATSSQKTPSAPALPLRRLTLFQHGLGFFVRSGYVEGDVVLDVARHVMDDVLKSITVVPSNATVRTIAFETPPDRNPSVRRTPLGLEPNCALSSLIAEFAGQLVDVVIGNRRISGHIIGMEREEEDHLKRGLLALSSDAGIELINLHVIERITLAGADANDDLAFALEERRRNTDRAQARISLSGPSDVDVSYTASAPAWRVSYRVLVEPAEPGADPNSRRVLLQGWGLFDNTLDEDLVGVELTLTAGMPVSFRYALHEPNTPERPLMADDRRVLVEAFDFDEMPMAGGASFEMAAAPIKAMAAAPQAKLARSRGVSASEVAASAPVQASGEARGALFAYRIGEPVSVRRGESGMVPIVEVRADAVRELLYNRLKTPSHPSVAVRFRIGPEVLERGPSTVLENGNYGGEAIVPFTSPGGEVVLGFALDLGIAVTPRQAQRTETRSLTISDGSLVVGVVDVSEWTYTIESSLAEAAIVTVEHPRQPDATLVTAPVESDAANARFRSEVPGRGSVELVVVEQWPRSYYQNVRGLDGLALKQYLDGKLLDKRTYESLAEVVRLQAMLSDHDMARGRRDQARGSIRARLEDVRANLSALDVTRDGPLRDRLVSQLEEWENKLAALDADDDAASAEADSIEASIGAALAAL